MALAPRDVKITREQVAGWLADFKRASNLPNFNTPLEEYLQQKIDALNLEDTDVNTTEYEQFASNSTPVVEMILADLPSYG